MEWEPRTGTWDDCVKADPSPNGLFYTKESAQSPGEEICAEAPKEGQSSRLSFLVRSNLWW
jgi:hypothetical protein